MWPQNNSPKRHSSSDFWLCGIWFRFSATPESCCDQGSSQLQPLVFDVFKKCVSNKDKQTTEGFHPVRLVMETDFQPTYRKITSMKEDCPRIVAKTSSSDKGLLPEARHFRRPWPQQLRFSDVSSSKLENLIFYIVDSALNPRLHNMESQGCLKDLNHSLNEQEWTMWQLQHYELHIDFHHLSTSSAIVWAQSWQMANLDIGIYGSSAQMACHQTSDTTWGVNPTRSLQLEFDHLKGRCCSRFVMKNCLSFHVRSVWNLRTGLL